MTGKILALGLLASVSTLPWAAAAAFAQDQSQVVPPAPGAPTDTGSGSQNVSTENERAIDFAADSVTYDQNSDVVIAEGNVTLMRNGMTFNADRVIYNRVDGNIQVEGEVWGRDADGNIITAEHLLLGDDFKSAVVENIGLILKDNSRFAARSGQLQDGRQTTLNRAVYSPCEVCADDPDRPPVWQVKAVRVVHDQDKKRVTYRNATLEAFGVPIFYTPYLSHPDPTVHAASGLLAPVPSRSSELGYVLKVPYYFSLAPNRDLTVEPILTTKEGFVLAGEYREHLGYGRYSVSGSGTYVDARDNFGVKTGKNEFRGHLFSKGRFDIDRFSELGGQWQWRYDVGVASDDTYLRRYDISKIDTIQSEVAMERFGQRSYAALTALGFQGLRVEDDGGLTPFALPMAEYHYVSRPGAWGGTYRFDANAAAITRFDGMDTRRVSVNGSWELPYIGQSGSVYTLGASLRGDLYHVNSANRPDEIAYAGRDGATARFLPQVRLEWRLPMVKEGRDTRQTFEPIIALIGAFEGGNPAGISNEDSRIIGFDDTNLFASNRFTGLDRWEGGSRIDYGVRYGVEGSTVSARMLVGQSYRFFSDDKIPAGTGLAGNWSDVVGRFEVTFSPYLDIIYRARLSDKSLAFRRNEVDAVFGPKNFKVSVGYMDLDSGTEDFDPTTVALPREEVRASAVYYINKNWSVSGAYTRDLDRKAAIAARAGILYEDECLQFGVFYDKRHTRDRDIEPESTILFKVVLKNLG